MAKFPGFDHFDVSFVKVLTCSCGLGEVGWRRRIEVNMSVTSNSGWLSGTLFYSGNFSLGLKFFKVKMLGKK